MGYILSIDQGTTGSRAIVYDKRGRMIAGSYKEFSQYFPQSGWVEHDPEEIWESVRSTVQRVLRKVPSGSIYSIGITNQRETTVVWDAETGESIYNAIVWQCRRTAPRCEALKKKYGPEFFNKKTGLPVDAYFSATKLEWILNNVKGARKKANSGKLRFGTTDSWILWKLTGGAVHATDYTNASRTMLFNIDKLRWDKDILKILNIPEGILPEVKPSSGLFGETIKIGKLPEGVPVSGIAGDQQASLFGQACFHPGTIKNTYGTGCFMLLNTGKKRLRSKSGLITTLACGPDGDPVYALEGAVFIAGAAVQWLRDGLKVLKKAEESEDLAASVKSTGGVYFVPALTGLGAPYWDPDARGSMHGITRGTTAAHIVRAALEAMCYQTRDVFDAMCGDSGIKITELKIDGGAAGNDFICSFQADVLGVPVIRPKDVETTSKGAAFLAGLASGFWKNAEDIKNCRKKERIFTPSKKREKFEELYAGWKEAVRRTLSEY